MFLQSKVPSNQLIISNCGIKRQKTSTSDLDTKDGISLLSLKHHLLLSYIQSLVLLSSHRALGLSLDNNDDDNDNRSRSPPSQPFSSIDRDARGSGPGDLVDSMIEGRIVLEKIKTLEGRMRYQIEKLVKVAEEETPLSGQNVIDGKYLVAYCFEIEIPL